MSLDSAAVEPAGQPAPRPDHDPALASQPEPQTPAAGDRVRATYPGGRTVEGIWSPTTRGGLDGFGLHTDKGHLHIHATGRVHCQVLISGTAGLATEHPGGTAGLPWQRRQRA